MDPALLNLHIRRGITFGGMQITCKDAAGAPIALAGWSAIGQIRSKTDPGVLIHDLAPVIAADDAAGLITIPKIPWETTATLAEGDYVYDIIPQNPAGDRLDPVLAGNVKISSVVTNTP